MHLLKWSAGLVLPFLQNIFPCPSHKKGEKLSKNYLPVQWKTRAYSNVRRWPQLKATSSEATPMEGGLNGRRPQRRSTSMKGDATSKEGDLRWRQHQRKATQPQWKVTSTEAASTDCDLNGKRPQRKTTLHWLRRILISCCWLTIMPALYKLVKIC